MAQDTPPVPGNVPQPNAPPRPPIPADATKGAQPTAPDRSTPTIQFESRGLHYRAITRNSVTVTIAPIPPPVKDYSVFQATITNGTALSWTVKPADFVFVQTDGNVLHSSSADDVVSSLLEKAGRKDVVRLQLIYESSIYALSNYRSNNGYEKRRETAMTQFVNPRFKAAAAASAVVMVPIKLKAGDSTDGAIFFESPGKEKTLGSGRMTVHTCGETFDFAVDAEGEAKAH